MNKLRTLRSRLLLWVSAPLLTLWIIPWFVGEHVMEVTFGWFPHHDHSETGRYRDTRISLFPGADLLYTDAYDALMSGVVSGAYLGSGYVGGVDCHHLAFRPRAAATVGVGLPRCVTVGGRPPWRLPGPRCGA